MSGTERKTQDQERAEFEAQCETFRNAAFPVTLELQYTSNPSLSYRATSKGLSKREHFAGLAMQGMWSNPESIQALQRIIAAQDVPGMNGAENVARLAVKAADALIEALAEPKKEREGT